MKLYLLTALFQATFLVASPVPGGDMTQVRGVGFGDLGTGNNHDGKNEAEFRAVQNCDKPKSPTQA